MMSIGAKTLEEYCSQVHPHLNALHITLAERLRNVFLNNTTIDKNKPLNSEVVAFGNVERDIVRIIKAHPTIFETFLCCKYMSIWLGCRDQIQRTEEQRWERLAKEIKNIFCHHFLNDFTHCIGASLDFVSDLVKFNNQLNIDGDIFLACDGVRVSKEIPLDEGIVLCPCPNFFNRYALNSRERDFSPIICIRYIILEGKIRSSEKISLRKTKCLLIANWRSSFIAMRMQLLSSTTAQ